jgi:hypothetical protein
MKLVRANDAGAAGGSRPPRGVAPAHIGSQLRSQGFATHVHERSSRPRHVDPLAAPEVFDHAVPRRDVRVAAARPSHRDHRAVRMVQPAACEAAARNQSSCFLLRRSPSSRTRIVASDRQRVVRRRLSCDRQAGGGSSTRSCDSRSRDVVGSSRTSTARRGAARGRSRSACARRRRTAARCHRRFVTSSGGGRRSASAARVAASSAASPCVPTDVLAHARRTSVSCRRRVTLSRTSPRAGREGRVRRVARCRVGS